MVYLPRESCCRVQKIDPTRLPAFAIRDFGPLCLVGMLLALCTFTTYEVLILRHQICILKRNINRPHVTGFEKQSLALLADKLRNQNGVSRRQLR